MARLLHAEACVKTPGLSSSRFATLLPNAVRLPSAQEVLMDFPQLTMTLPDGREESIMKRTTLVRADLGIVADSCFAWAVS